MSVLGGNPLLLGSADAAFTTQRSVRLRSSASAYFNRTLTTPTNNKIWTWSGWVKRGSLSTNQRLFFATGTDNLFFTSSDTLAFYINAATSGSLITTQVFRDPSAWYHLVLAVDTTQATSTNRLKLYVNGSQITAFGTASYPTQNYNTFINSAVSHAIGAYGVPATQDYFDGYLTEVNFIDGQALTPSSFGEYDSVRNTQWKPKRYTGTYGTNGFYLNFSDNSNNTAATIGKDSSGNGNNWTPNGISITAGATYDSMTDVPTLTSATAANFATLNPLQRFDTSSFAGVYSSANLIVASGGNPTHAFGSIAIPIGNSDGWYWEGVCTSMDTARTYIGICSPADGPSSVGASYAFTTKGVLSNTNAYYQANTSGVGNDGTFTSYAANDVMMVAYKNGKLWIGKNGTWMNSGNPAADTGALSSTLSTSKEWFPYFGYNSTWSTNFGQRPFSYTPPTGFLALNTYNLPNPAVASSDDYHNIYTYTGNGGGLQVGEVQKPASLFNLDRSLRFRASASAYLSRTPASATNQRTWTWSAWVKRGSLATEQMLFEGGVYSGSTEQLRLFFTSTDNLEFNEFSSAAYQFRYVTTQVFRDPNMWYHIVAVLDTPNLVGKLYVNGIQITSFSTSTAPTLNFQGKVNSVIAHDIGRRNGTGTPYLDGYLADVYLIDGQPLTPTDFGTYDGNYYWTPKAYTGTYGTNGFHLEFEDFSASTAAAIGKDTSGQGNNWTPTNINLTTPATTNTSWDSMTDVPTLTSADVANYCVIDRLRSNTGITITEANLKASITSSSQENLLCNMGVSTGKWYWEVTTTFSGADCIIGIVDSSVGTTRPSVTNTAFQIDLVDGRKWDGATSYAYASAFTSGDTLGIALDLDVGSITFYKNGVSLGVAFNNISKDKTWFASQWKDGAGASYTSSYNFGQRPFRYTAPAGFKSINSFNIAEVTGDVETPDFVWIKSRSAGTNHALFNSVIGVGRYGTSVGTTAETTDVNSLIQFNKNGFLLGNSAIANTLSATYVASAWKIAATTVTNTNGTISSQVRANPTIGTSVVTYTGNGIDGSTVGHGLASVPKFIMVKSRNNSSNTRVFHTSLGATYNLYLNSTNLRDVITATAGGGIGTSPTSNVFTCVTGATSNANNVNTSTWTYVAYCFAEIDGFSKFTSYIANGSSTDGPFVFCGFQPRWLMIKRAIAGSGTGGWIMYDTARDRYNVMSEYLFAEGASGVGTLAAIDTTSNGFKIRTNNVHINQTSGDTYIVMAFAEHPFKYALAR